MDQRDQYSEGNGIDGFSTGSDAETIQFDAIGADAGYAASGSTGTTDAGQDIGGTVRGTVQQVQETAGNVAGQAQETVGRVADQVRQTASTRLEDQKNRAVEGISNVAEQVREMSLNMQDQGAVAEYMDRAAWQLQRFSDYLQEKDLRDLVIEAEHFARRQPTMFLAGGFLLGLLGARFLKSSARQLQTQGYAGGGSGGSSSGSQVVHFTTQGDNTVEGRAGLPVDADGGDTFRSTYVVTPRDGGSED
ncbi:MAG TPA: hypothetical protein VND68_09380 [Chloroflexia bacterium]|nr:hypothetical protein [Chloroflexia bacterium]